MQINQIITDYIRRSLLTTAGDLIVRGAAEPERLAGGAAGTVLVGQGAGVKPQYAGIYGGVTEYLKGSGAGLLPDYGDMALRDTGIDIGNHEWTTGGDVTVTCGFEPSLVIILFHGSAGVLEFSIGFDDGTSHQCIYISYGGTLSGHDFSNAGKIYHDATNLLTLNVTAKGATGYVLTATKTGTTQGFGVYCALP